MTLERRYLLGPTLVCGSRSGAIPFFISSANFESEVEMKVFLYPVKAWFYILKDIRSELKRIFEEQGIFSGYKKFFSKFGVKAEVEDTGDSFYFRAFIPERDVLHPKEREVSLILEVHPDRFQVDMSYTHDPTPSVLQKLMSLIQEGNLPPIEFVFKDDFKDRVYLIFNPSERTDQWYAMFKPKGGWKSVWAELYREVLDALDPFAYTEATPERLKYLSKELQQMWLVSRDREGPLQWRLLNANFLVSGWLYILQHFPSPIRAYIDSRLLNFSWWKEEVLSESPDSLKVMKSLRMWWVAEDWPWGLVLQAKKEDRSHLFGSGAFPYLMPNGEVIIIKPIRPYVPSVGWHFFH